MRKMEISMAMICQLDKYHLQHRTGPEGIGSAGLIGFFGGKLKPGETHDAAMARELAEETNIKLRLKDLQDVRQLKPVDVVFDWMGKPLNVHASVFEVLLPYGFDMKAKEGELVTWTQKEIIDQEDRLTPATKEFFKGYFK